VQSGVGSRHQADDGGLHLDRAGRELATEPLDGHRVVGEPRVGGRDLGEALLQRRPGLLDRLAERHAEPALGDEQVRHAAGPVPGPDRADRERVGHVVVRHQRRGTLVADGLQPPQRLVHQQVLLDRVHALGPHRAVRRETGDAQPEGQRAGARRDQGARRGLAHHRQVAAVAALQRRERAQSAVLLADDTLQLQPAAQSHPRLPQRLDRHHLARQPALHVARTATQDPTCTHRAGPRRARPRVGRADRHDVQVAVEHNGRAVFAAPGADQAPGLVARGLHAREVRVGGRRREVDRPQVGLHAGDLQSPGEPVLTLALRGAAGHRGDREQLLQQGHQSSGIDVPPRRAAPGRLARPLSPSRSPCRQACSVRT